MDGLKTHASAFGPEETMDRLEAEVRKKGMPVFARINHAAGAAEVGLPLRATELLIFGSAKVGTPLMQQVQTIGLDLPLKILVWQDSAGKSWLAYYDLVWLLGRHGLAEPTHPSIIAMTTVLSALAKAATEAT